MGLHLIEKRRYINQVPLFCFGRFNSSDLITARWRVAPPRFTDEAGSDERSSHLFLRTLNARMDTVSAKTCILHGEGKARCNAGLVGTYPGVYGLSRSLCL